MLAQALESFVAAVRAGDESAALAALDRARSLPPEPVTLCRLVQLATLLGPDHGVRGLDAVVDAWQRSTNALLDALPAEGWNTFDRAFRERSFYEFARGQGHAPYGDEGEAREVFGPWVEALARDGHTRERAIRELGRPGTTRALPVLTVRLADWVDAVRGTAERVWAEVIDRADAADVVRILPLVEVVRSGTRVDGERIDRVLDARLGRPDAVAAMRDALQGGTRATRRAAHARLLRGLGPEERLRELDTSAGNPDAALRWDALRALLSLPESSERSRVLERYASDVSPLVRASALRALLESDAGTAERARAHVLDPARRVRSVARFHAQRLDPTFDARAAALAHVRAGDPELNAAIVALMDVAESSDLARVEPFLDGAAPRVVRAIVDATPRLVGAGATEQLRAWLDHGSETLGIAAARQLIALGEPLEPDIVRAWLGPEVPEGTRRARLALVRGLDGPERLALLLDVAERATEATRPAVLSELGALASALDGNAGGNWRNGPDPALHRADPGVRARLRQRVDALRTRPAAWRRDALRTLTDHLSL